MGQFKSLTNNIKLLYGIGITTNGLKEIENLIRNKHCNFPISNFEFAHTGRTPGHDYYYYYYLIYFLLTAIVYIVLLFYHTNVALCVLLWQTYSMFCCCRYHSLHRMMTSLMTDNLEIVSLFQFPIQIQWNECLRLPTLFPTHLRNPPSHQYLHRPAIKQFGLQPMQSILSPI